MKKYIIEYYVGYDIKTIHRYVVRAKSSVEAFRKLDREMKNISVKEIKKQMLTYVVEYTDVNKHIDTKLCHNGYCASEVRKWFVANMQNCKLKLIEEIGDAE